LRWNFVVLLISPYFVDVAWQKLLQCVLIFQSYFVQCYALHWTDNVSAKRLSSLGRCPAGKIVDWNFFTKSANHHNELERYCLSYQNQRDMVKNGWDWQRQ